uniref:Rare lipoprotein A n=1 Tax=Talaromyces marneffei PM1 TaxID=1077442 RepID=A0A093VA56_TALMA
MSVILSILAAGSLPALILGAPVPFLLSRNAAVADLQSLQTRSSSAYTLFGGDGTIAAGWPSIDNWVATYDEMFNANKATMSSSCTYFGAENDSADEINDIYNAIKSVSASSGVDPRFILAILMQESNGCVRVHTTNYGVNNPGLMQSHNGKGTCNSGTPVTPCPADEITQMIEDGTTGTADGDGLKQLLDQAVSRYGASGATEYYVAARMYNSGSVAPGGNLGQGGATACYSSDIANRLLGWSGTTPCKQTDVEALTHTVGTFLSGNDGSAPSAPSITTTNPVAPNLGPATNPVDPSLGPATDPVAPSTSPATANPVPANLIAPSTTLIDTAPVAPPPATTTTIPLASAIDVAASAPSSHTTTPVGPVYPGAVSTCQKWTVVVSGDYCLEVEEHAGVSASQFMDWNPGLDAACSNLWLGYNYCIQA